MRKRLSIICVVVILSLIFSACSSKKPDGMSDEIYKAGIQAIEIADRYLQSEIDSDEACQKIEEIYSALPQSSSEYPLDSGATLMISCLNLEFSTLSSGFLIYDDAEITNTRNLLADGLGVDQIELEAEDRSGIKNAAVGLAQDAIRITDAFLDGELAAEETVEKLKDLCQKDAYLLDHDNLENEMITSVLVIASYIEYFEENSWDFVMPSIIEERNKVASFGGASYRYD